MPSTSARVVPRAIQPRPAEKIGLCAVVRLTASWQTLYSNSALSRSCPLSPCEPRLPGYARKQPLRLAVPANFIDECFDILLI